MKTLLTIVASCALSLPVFAADKPMPSGSRDTNMSGSTAPAERAQSTAAKSTRDSAKLSASGNARLTQDLAQCKTMVGDDRRTCEREMYAARAEGLYRD